MTHRIQTHASKLCTAAVLLSLLSAASAQDASELITPTLSDIIPDPALSLAAKDWDALRAWFHQPEFNISDGLVVYADDYHSIVSGSPRKLTSR